MQARLVASGHYLRTIDAESLPPLRDDLAAACRLPFRRIDRFVQLALIGSSRCAQNHALNPDCSLYIASAMGPMGSNIRTQKNMLYAHEWPMPFDFINTLGGSAGFYVASNLGLRGQNEFLGGRKAWMAAVETAMIDLQAGVAGQALVGVVEEVPLPLHEHRSRLRVAADTSLAEGSHWWLLERDDSGSGRGPQLGFEQMLDPQMLTSWLATNGAQTRILLDDSTESTKRIEPASSIEPTRPIQPTKPIQPVEPVEPVEPVDRILNDHHYPYERVTCQPTLPYHASEAAAWFSIQLERDPTGSIAVISNEGLLHYCP